MREAHKLHTELRTLATSGLDLMVAMPVLSETLHRMFPSFSLSMIRVDERCAPREHYSEHFDEQSHRMFAESGHLFATSRDDPAAFGKLLSARRPVGNLIHNPADYLSGATYQHLFRRNGIHHCLDVAVRSAAGPLGILGVFREAGARPFTTDDVARMNAAYGELVHAFEARALVGDFDELESAVLVVDRGGRIEWASRAARAWLADASVGEERALLLDRAELPRAVLELAKRLQRREPEHLPTLVLPAVGGRLRLRAYALAAPSSPSSPSGPSTAPDKLAVQLSFEGSRLARVHRHLCDQPLAPRLRELAFALYRATVAGDASTREPGEHARAALGVSRETFKSYRKELYVRLDVSSVAELRAKLDAAALATRLDLERHRPRPEAEAGRDA